MAGKRKGGGGDEIDAVKAFIVIMAVLTVGLAGYTFFWMSPRRSELEIANAVAKKTCRQMFYLKEDIDRYLTAYDEARETGFTSPEEYFEGVREISRIDPSQRQYDPKRPSSGAKKGYNEYYTGIELKDISWAQAIQFMWNTEHKSPKYKVLSIDDLRRSDKKNAEDRWRLRFKAAYRTQREE